MAANYIVSPLTEALYGSEFEIDGKNVVVRKNVEVADHDDNIKTVLFRLFDRLMMENQMRCDGQVFEPDTKDELYGTIKSNVLTCKMFSSRHIGRCYITNKNYGENCPHVYEYVFDAAQAALGARWFYSSFPYHKSAEQFLPFANLCFNFDEYIVPVRCFPNMSQHSDGKKYIVVNVKRTSGAIQRGLIKTDNKSMVVYRSIQGSSFAHPAYVSPGTKIEPTITTYFNYDGSDIDFSSMETDCPLTNCTKDIPVERLIESNPMLADAFRIGDEQIAGFGTAFEVSVMDVVELV
jgi:hypothetical protein